MAIRKIMIVCTVALMALGSAAKADQKMSGPLFAFTQDNLVCHVTSVGFNIVRDVELEIWDLFAGKVIAKTSCGELPVQGYCNAVANSVVDGAVHACRVTTSADDITPLRGTFEVRSTSSPIGTLVTAPLL